MALLLLGKWERREVEVGEGIPDLNLIATIIALLDVDVDGEMSVDISHLVLVAFRNAGDEVLNDGFDRP